MLETVFGVVLDSLKKPNNPIKCFFCNKSELTFELHFTAVYSDSEAVLTHDRSMCFEGELAALINLKSLFLARL